MVPQPGEPATGQARGPKGPEPGLTPRQTAPLHVVGVLAIGLVTLVVANLWVRQAALITISAQVGMAVPPIPALAALLIMLWAYPLVRRLGMSRTDILAVYCFLALAVALTSGGAMRFFLPALPTLFYFSGPESDWSAFQQHIPAWMAPTGGTVIRGFFEGAEGTSVPWGAWAGPLALWLGFFTAFFGLLICLAVLFRPVWEEHEHLTYPVAELPLLLAGYRKDLPHVWAHSPLWVGFGLASLYDLMNILNGFNPGIPALGTDAELNHLLTEWPWTVLQPLRVSYRPEILGFGYLMPTEIALSTVFLYFVYVKGTSLIAAMIGVHNAQLPYENQQASGAYLALGVLLIYGARQRIAEVFGRLRQGTLRARALPLAVVACALAVCGFWLAAGMSLRVLIPYFALVLVFGLGYARLRAESGYPRMWGRPLGGERDLLLDLLGTGPLSPGGDMRSLTLLSSSFYLARGYMAQLMSYPSEAFRIGSESRIPVRTMAGLMLAAVVLGIAVSWWMHLGAYYEYGANILEGGTTSGGYRISLMREAYTDLADWARTPASPRRAAALASGAGFLMVMGLMWLRKAFLRFPLHPLSLILAYTGGGYTGWAMLLMVSLIKIGVLRVGGMRAYRNLIPVFIGIAVGHYFAAGLVWGLISSYGGETLVQRYQLWF